MEAFDHRDRVNAWIARVVDGRPRPRVIDAFEGAFAALWQRAYLTLGEVTLVECETKFPVFEDVVGPRLIIAASRAFHWWPGSKDVASVGSIPAPLPQVQRGLHLGGE